MRAVCASLVDPVPGEAHNGHSEAGARAIMVVLDPRAPSEESTVPCCWPDCVSEPGPCPFRRASGDLRCCGAPNAGRVRGCGQANGARE